MATRGQLVAATEHNIKSHIDNQFTSFDFQCTNTYRGTVCTSEVTTHIFVCDMGTVKTEI
jgi:hypothetical protein